MDDVPVPATPAPESIDSFTMTPCDKHWEQIRVALPEPFWLLVVAQAMKLAAESLVAKGERLEAYEAQHEGECFICLTSENHLIAALRDIRDEVNARLGVPPFDPGEKRDVRPPKGFLAG